MARQIVDDDVVIAAQTIFDDVSEQTGVIEIAVQDETGAARLPDRELVADDFVFATGEMAEVVAYTGHETLEIEPVEKKILLNGIAVLNFRSRLTQHLGREALHLLMQTFGVELDCLHGMTSSASSATTRLQLLCILLNARTA